MNKIDNKNCCESEFINGNQILLRRATIADLDRIYTWRNADETRQFFFHTEQITKEQHTEWFTATLKNSNRIVLIAELAQQAIGVLRYDILDDQAEINIYLVPGMHGKGFGAPLIKAGNNWLKENNKTVKKVIAKVLNDNIASQKAFTKAGFEAFYQTYEYFF